MGHTPRMVQVAEGDPLAPMPTIPPAPPAPTIPGGAKPGIRARTLENAARFKTHVNYTQPIGQDLGIIATPPATGDPSIASLQALPFSQVRVSLNKAGYDVVAIDMKRAGGDWTQLIFATNTPWIDMTPPLVAGQPEQREYRCQGVLNNQRVGPVSAPAVVVTTP